MNSSIMDRNEVLNLFEGYQKITSSKLTLFCVQGKARYNRSIETLLWLYMFLSFLLDNEKTFLPNNANEAISLQYNKTAGIVFAIKACLEVGQLLAAASLIRDLFEILIDCSILTERDAEERSYLYLNYGIVQQWLHLRNHKDNLRIIQDKHGDGKELAAAQTYYKRLTEPDLEKQANDNYAKVKEHYHHKKPYHWAWKLFRDKLSDRNPNIKYLSQEYNLYDDYIKVYSLNSLSVHNSSLGKSMLLQRDVITCAPNYSVSITSLSAECYELASKILMLIVRHSGSEYSDQIKDILDRTFVEVY